jgi:PKD repeat protein
MVEFALVVPVMMLLLLIAIDFGRLFFSYIEVANAAREGVAYGAASPASPNAAILAVATQETNTQRQAGENPISVAATCADASGTAIACPAAAGASGGGSTMTVTVSERFSFFTPLINGFFGNNLTMRASATAVVLGLAGQSSGTPPGTCSAPSLATFTVSVTGLSIFANPSASQPDSGLCAISGYNWTWGDGQSDVGTAVGSPHTYGAAGTYLVTLVVTNQGGSAQHTQSVTVTSGGGGPSCSVPIASFSYTSTGKTFNFSDTSYTSDPVNCPITAWAWNFGDGSVSNAPNPTYTYGSANQHTVTLRVTNAAGTSAPYTHTQ